MPKSKTISLKLIKRVKETADTTTFIFAKGNWIYEEGEYITLLIPIGSTIIRRAYSLSSSPTWGEPPAITVKRVAGGIISNYLNDYFQVGDTLEALPPQGHFTLPKIPPKEIVLLAGGSGIAPIYALLKKIVRQQPTIPVTLLYANHTPEQIIYKQQLQQCQAQYNQLHLIYAISQQNDQSVNYPPRLNQEEINIHLVHPLQNTETHYFLCGPLSFMHLCKATLHKQGVDRERIHQESFYAPLPELAHIQTKSEVTFTTEERTSTTTMQRGETVLQAAQREGIEIPYACVAGTCNTCRVKCTQGQVIMSEDEGLTQKEIQDGYILSCVGYPTTPHLKITIEEEW